MNFKLFVACLSTSVYNELVWLNGFKSPLRIQTLGDFCRFITASDPKVFALEARLNKIKADQIRYRLN